MSEKKVDDFLAACSCRTRQVITDNIKSNMESAQRKLTECSEAILKSTLMSESLSELILVCNQLYLCLSHKLGYTGKYKNSTTDFNPTLYVCSASLSWINFEPLPKNYLPLVIQCFDVSVLDCLKLLKNISNDSSFKILNEYSQSIITCIIQSVLWDVDSVIWCKIEEHNGNVPSFQDLKFVMDELARQRHVVGTSKIIEKPNAQHKVTEDVGKKCDVSRLLHTWKPSFMAAFLESYNYAYTQFKDLCDILCVSKVLQDIWNAFNHALTNYCKDILFGRKLDHLILCILYAVCKALPTIQQQEFKTIFHCYKMLSNSDPDINKCVNLVPSPTKTFPDNSESLAVVKDKSDFDSKSQKKETKDELVIFYNKVFLPKMKTYFKENLKSAKSASSVKHSPLPDHRGSPVRVSNNLYISPMKAVLRSPPRCIEYKFSSSPGSQLQYINEMVRNSPVTKRQSIGDLNDYHNAKCAKRISFNSDNQISSKSRIILPR